MDEMTFSDFADKLLAPPEPGAVTDYKRARFLETNTPNVSNAWTHVVPALAKYAKFKGKRGLSGRDKGEMAYRELEEKLHLVVLGLYADGLLSQGARTEDCLLATLLSLVAFKEAYPNWGDAYSAGYEVFVEGRDNINIVLARHQQAVEAQLY